MRLAGWILVIMKVLLVHNFYGSSAPSGENVVFNAEKALLEQHGHTLEVFTRDSDEIRRQGFRGAIKGAASTPWNPFAVICLLYTSDAADE